MPRIEHAPADRPGDRPRFAAAGIAASVQPVHLRSDAAQARRLWGDRAERTATPGARWPRPGRSSPSGPTRRSSRSTRGRASRSRSAARTPRGRPDAAAFGPGEAFTLDRALRARLRRSGGLGRGADRGRLTVGQRADVGSSRSAALDDPVGPDGALATARPSIVLVDGRVVFER